MSSEQHYYLGIDLGTTNSSIHWGALNPQSNRIEPRTLAFDQMTSDGSVQRRVLLPSYVWFPQDAEPIVGEYARTRGLEAQPSRVARAIKNHMGEKNWSIQVDGRSLSAVELTQLLLRELYAGIRGNWGIDVADVVITVPASFDGDMRAATLQAAEGAGFKVRESNGAPRNLLLDEPRAALYDLLNQQLSGHLPQVVLDLSTPKVVLVFDLGGGTLDVSLHRVGLPDDRQDLNVEDLAISRYTQLGGGVFDNLVANALQQQFEARWKLSLAELPASDRNQVRTKLEIQAEQVKQRFTNDIEARLRRSADGVPDDYAVDVQMPFLYDNKGLIMRITKAEFEQIIAPLLGWNLDLSLASAFDAAAVPADNIVYPILDVLHKASLRLGALPKVDSVVLNGGMTRVHAVRNRLEALFGLRPITVLDPEHAVSRGAAIYHFLLHKGWRPTQILAETISVEVEGNRLFTLAPAGTVLPFQASFPDRFFVSADNATSLSIPLYRGEGRTPGVPNRKLLERRALFQRPLPEATSVTVELNIDENKVVDFTAVLPGGDRLGFQVGAESALPSLPGAVPRPKVQEPARPLSDGLPMPPGEFQTRFRNASGIWDEVRLKEIGNQALNARNLPELLDVLLGDFHLLTRPGKQRSIWLMGEFAVRWPNDPRIPRISDVCVDALRKSIGVPSVLNTVGNAAVVALAKIGSQTAESVLIATLNDERAQRIRGSVLMALGRCARTGNTVKHISQFVDSPHKADRIYALWSLGRLGSREQAPVVPMKYLVEVIPLVGKHALRKAESHIDARQYAIFALGEIGDRRKSINPEVQIDAHSAEGILLVFQQVSAELERMPASEMRFAGQYEHLKRLVEIARKQVQGVALTADETRILLGVRTLMSINNE